VKDISSAIRVNSGIADALRTEFDAPKRKLAAANVNGFGEYGSNIKVNPHSRLA
jgi:hypothetical protein